MDAGERKRRKRLKRTAEQVLDRQAADLQAASAAANPARPASRKWAENYREQTLREQEIRSHPPDFIAPEQAHRNWVTFPVGQMHSVPFPSVTTWFYECLTCGSLLNSAPHAAVACVCKKVALDPQSMQAVIHEPEAVRLVKLLARVGQEDSRPSWWRRLLGR